MSSKDALTERDNMSDNTLKDLAEVLKLLPEESRLTAIDKLSSMIQSKTQDIKVEGNHDCHVLSFNNAGNNDVRFGGGGWTSKKTGNTPTTRSAEFKVQDKGPYFSREWVSVYDHVRSITGVWAADQADGNLMPPHNGKEWNGKGKALGLQLGTGTSCPDTYHEVSQDELRYCSGPAGTRLGLRKQVYDKAVEMGLIVPKAASDASSDATAQLEAEPAPKPRKPTFSL